MQILDALGAGVIADALADSECPPDDGALETVSENRPNSGCAAPVWQSAWLERGTRGGRVPPKVMAAFGLTEREQDVTRLVLQGFTTAGIASSLTVTAQSVQQHLKRIFEKPDVHSRRELVGKVFFAWYEPRLRDNEARALAGRPLRGGPLAPAGESGVA